METIRSAGRGIVLILGDLTHTVLVLSTGPTIDKIQPPRT